MCCTDDFDSAGSCNDREPPCIVAMPCKEPLVCNNGVCIELDAGDTVLPQTTLDDSNPSTQPPTTATPPKTTNSGKQTTTAMPTMVESLSSTVLTTYQSLASLISSTSTSSTSSTSTASTNLSTTTTTSAPLSVSSDLDTTFIYGIVGGVGALICVAVVLAVIVYRSPKPTESVVAGDAEMSDTTQHYQTVPQASATPVLYGDSSFSTPEGRGE